ncbi:hypothetical protein [Burkholderia alba]|uniref:hypothetical protein n=1 Tax=Burkholderia alba TaxID=2683677 RepID=UPI002B053CBE|nr:hypothetical protein [Burkholderia alba]
MPLAGTPWNSLDAVRLVVDILTPLSVTALGWLISRRLKRLEFVQWTNQKLIEKRLEIYDTIAPQLNRLLCFYTWVGHWKDISPDDVVRTKRELDKTIHIYRHLFDDDVYLAYQGFIHALFETHAGAGQDAKIRSHVEGPHGDRSRHGSYAWNPAWTARFSSVDVADREDVRLRYFRIMDRLRAALGASR